MTGTGWQQHAACAGIDWWWDNNREPDCTRICATCPVTHECLTSAFAADATQEHAERLGDLDDAREAHDTAHAAGDPVAIADAEAAVARAERALERPLTGRPRSTFGIWGGTGPRARRAGAAAYRAGGDTWAAAYQAHVAWLDELGDARKLPAHPWNQTGREQIVHGLPGSYNHCVAGPGGSKCEACRFGKGRHTDRRRERGAAA